MTVLVLGLIVAGVVIFLMVGRHNAMVDEQRRESRTKQQKRIDRSLGRDE